MATPIGIGVAVRNMDYRHLVLPIDGAIQYKYRFNNHRSSLPKCNGGGQGSVTLPIPTTLPRTVVQYHWTRPLRTVRHTPLTKRRGAA